MAVVPLPCVCGGTGGTEQCGAPLATTGLCLGDGTPIAVVVVRDCPDAVAQSGWINLLTGVYTPGNPPAGTRDCGERDYEITHWCDLAADGSVINQVLVEYEYDEETGRLVGTRVMDLLGNDYTLQGTLGTCLHEETFQHQEILCDHRSGGGTTTSPMTLGLTGVPVPGIQHISSAPRDVADVNYGAQVWAGGTHSFPSNIPVTAGQASDSGAHTHFTVRLDPGAVGCGEVDETGNVEITAEITFRNDGPVGGGWDQYGSLRLFNGDALVPGTDMPIFAEPGGSFFDPGETRTVAITGTVPYAALAAGNITLGFNLETGPDPGAPAGLGTEPKSWTLSNASVSAVADVTGCVNDGPVIPFIRKYIQNSRGTVVDTVDLTFDGLGYNVEGAVGRCLPDDPEQTFGIQLCDVQPDGTVVPFLRTYTVHCGEIIQSCDKDLGGIDDYEPTGEVRQCPIEVTSDCRNCESLELCDTVSGPRARIAAAVGTSSGALSNGITWASTGHNGSGGTTNPYPSTKSNADGAWWGLSSFPQVYNPVSIWTFNRPSMVEFSVWGLWDAGTNTPLANVVQLPAGVEPVSLPPGYVFDPASSQVRFTSALQTNCDDIASPTVAKSARFRTTEPVTSLTMRYLGPRIANCGVFGNWNFGAFDVWEGGTTPFIRTLCRNCEGQVVSTTDTRPDGSAYQVRGVVGKCRSTGCGGCETTEVQDSGSAPFTLTALQTDPTPYAAVTPTPGITIGDGCNYLNPNPIQPLFDGGVVNFPQTPTACADGSHNWAAGVLNLPDGCLCGVDTIPAGALRVSSRFTSTAGTARGGGSAIWLINGTTEVGVAGVPGGAGNRLITAINDTPIPVSDLLAGRVVALYQVEGGQQGQFKSWNVSAFQASVSVSGCGTRFLRTICRDCNGAIVNVRDTLLDGVTPFSPVGEVHAPIEADCGPQLVRSECSKCQTIQLCDLAAPAAGPEGVIRGDNLSDGVADNGIGWSVIGSSGAPDRSEKDTADGAWWSIATYPNSSYGLTTLTLDTAATVEFSVNARYRASADPTFNQAQLPAGLRVVSLPAGYSYNAVTGVLTIGPELAVPPCPDPVYGTPLRENSARFLITEPVTSLQWRYLGNAVPVCGEIGPFQLGGIVLNPGPTPFLRTICRDCDGEVVGEPTDTMLDGTTPYSVVGEIMACSAVPERDCCQPESICIQQDPVQTVEFISNEAHLQDNSVDPVWQWTPNGDALPTGDPQHGPAANATYYPMYRAANPPLDRWSIVDTDTERPAWWVSPHPGSTSLQANPPFPGEGPSLANNTEWFARSSFVLPEGANPATIKVQVTVLNADQQGTGFRLNNGAWQQITPPQGGFEADDPEQSEPTVFGPIAIPGAQPGVNTLYFRVLETVGGFAGVMSHMIVTYEIARPAMRAWTRMICCDGSSYFIDEDGVRHSELPEGWSIVPCSAGSSSPVPLCDDNGTFIRHYTYLADGSVSISDTDMTGALYSPVGTVRACGT